MSESTVRDDPAQSQSRARVRATQAALTDAGLVVRTIADQSNLAQPAMTLWVTATAAVNTALTATLPAVAGQFHYIVYVELVKLYSVVGVAAAGGVVITSTNLPGSPAWLTEQAVGAQGTAVKVIQIVPATPLKSSVVNTATTFVAPQQLQTIWRWNIGYFTAA